ncbi:MAG: peptidoglycan DD-metalloendopeptidase family protein [Steroidobacteraceae bacterium]
MIKKLMAWSAPIAAAAGAALLLWHTTGNQPAADSAAPAPIENTSASVAGPDAAAPAAPSPADARQAEVVSTIEIVVGRNDTLDAIFRRASLDLSDLAAIRNLPGIRASIDSLKPGDAIELKHVSGAIRELTRKVSETQTLHVEREDAGFAVHMIDNPVETRIRTASAVIDSSLFQAAEAAEISDGIALKLANIFAWDIDFVLDIRDGDRYTVVYEQIYQDGKKIRDGEILAAEFVNNGRVYRAASFKSDSGHLNYYAPNGLAMRKAFLRAPVEFTRVSSQFNPHRMHPILQTIRGHMGTDYAAPTGTPVHASGDGRVSFAGRRGGYGNAIVLAHTNSISTLYGHMSRFAKQVRVGAHVQQGDVIGYVGMTGLATGPHLHYEYLVNGMHKNPQTVQLPGAEPLRAESLQRFLSESAPLLSRLEPPAASTATTSVVPGAIQSGTAPAHPQISAN